ncbi:MAG: PfkB family carbohydrate kinase [Halanaeroarchaeum sp.]
MHDIRDRLVEEASPTVTVLPDGSVDRRFAVLDESGAPLSRERLAEEIFEEAKTFVTRPLGTEPGGQAVNAAWQLHALGADTTLVGHLDDPIFAELPFDRYSMGDPAEVLVYELEDGVVMMANESEDILTWTLARLQSAVGPTLEDLLTADAVLWTNWAGFPHATPAIQTLDDLVPDGTVLVIDPGAVSTRPGVDRVALLDALGEVEFAFDVVLSPNRREADHLGDAMAASTDDREALAEAIRERADIEAVVVHDHPTATVATRTGTIGVPTVAEAVPARHAGGGDRFSAGVAYGLAAGWSWEETVTLGNTCATHYLVAGTDGTPEDLSRLVSSE